MAAYTFLQLSCLLLSYQLCAGNTLQELFYNQIQNVLNEAPPSAYDEPVLPPHPQEVEGWGESLLGKIGQVSGVTVNHVGQPVIFHRGPRVWDATSFNVTKDFQHREQGPIREDTVLVLDPHSGKVLSSWGRDFFYMPHGIHVDWEGNTWLTDTALHQVFKFSPGARRPGLTFGQRFKHGDGLRELCQPTSVAVASTGEIFVADGYCNSRILKFDGMGNLIRVFPQKQEFLSLEVPHSLALLEHRDLLCIGDRENMRVACIGAKLRDRSPGPGLTFTIQQPDLGRVFGIASHGDLVYAVNGKTSPTIPTQGFTLDPLAETMLDHWGPTSTAFNNPHAIAISQDGHSLYVVEIGPNRVWKFELKPNYEPNNDKNTF
ncbi:peptidyl-alpha-hydroxyglycine alpha-amidating lyase 2-like [Macrosteles quadrilineatus]|uniref:peptidyl-alpha-hydroxyglycine alpha-amidating lyase 2-like n=1 Tax=Macrosteles quadrilineatus TaxID=74068 RepID=UPI0023E1D2DE|nr:peptidyl-alpha-hydroxyglycine alpha-amidating lyase 2-like [Macrosteles quadrilineatus]